MQSEIHRELTNQIDSAVELFLETGIAYIVVRNSSEQSYMSGICMRRFLRDVAKEQRRPFVYAERRIYRTQQGSIHVCIPRPKRLDPVRGYFMLLARQPLSSRYCYKADDGPVCWTQTKTNDDFSIQSTEQGEALFEGWLNQCRTDPVYRVALKK